LTAQPKQAPSRNKRVKKDLLPTIGKESTKVISKAVPSSNKGDCTESYRQALWWLAREHIPEYVQFKVIAQEGKMVETFLGLLSSLGSTYLKG
jgi:hypothetical protein